MAVPPGMPHRKTDQRTGKRNPEGFSKIRKRRAGRRCSGSHPCVPASTYRDQFVKLVDKGYLVRRGKSNIYDFYETPQRVTHTEPIETIDGLDFTADAYGTPQTVNTTNVGTVGKNSIK